MAAAGAVKASAGAGRRGRADNGGMTHALGLFARWPRPGEAKTRLAAATSPPWAADIALAFLRDSLQRLGAVEARRTLVFTPPDAGELFRAVAGSAYQLRPQIEGDLGRRLAAYLGAALAEGAERVVVVGADSPTLPVDYVQAALEQLGRADVVLGPATDGGYYLLGCARRLPPLFEGIPWGGSEVASATVARVRAAGLQLALLPPWYDVDTLDDWYMLRGHVRAMRCAGLDPQVPHTEALLDGPG
jgi:rSAM/selenodomain-associated transferase 1